MAIRADEGLIPAGSTSRRTVVTPVETRSIPTSGG
jgi:hypothetical protein